ncbi:hypothetical protein R5R35_014818 [Gryllus longicercus]
MPPNPASPSAPPRADEKLLMVAEDFSEVPMKALLDEGAVPPPPPPAAAAAAAAEPVDEDRPKDRPVPWEIKWRNVVILSVMHLWTLYSLTYIPYIKWQTYLWTFLLTHLAGFGVTGGAHRLWTHRSYKAKLPLRIIMMIGHGLAGMNSIFDWVRDHRVHHKFSETDADPHNARRGFFFSHVGWLMVKKHPEVVRRGQTVDMSDVLADPVVQFQRKHHLKMFYVLCFLIPTVVPVYFWNEDWMASFCACMARWVIGVNFVWSVNSAAHLYGGHPFNKYINPADNRFVSFMCMGEGWHNYHHVFPWDYKASEYGHLNTTMHIIKLFERIGWAYDLKTAPTSLVRRVATRYGDGSHPEWAAYAPEIPEEAAKDHSVVDRLLPPLHAADGDKKAA